MIIFLALNFGASDHGAVTAVMCGVETGEALHLGAPRGYARPELQSLP